MIENKKLSRSRIGTQLVIFIVLCSSAITLLITSIQIYLDYRNDLKQIKSYEQLIKSSYLNSLKNSIWDLNERQIFLQLEGMLRLPDLEYVEILVDKRKVWSTGETRAKYTMKMEFPMIQDHMGKDILIGQLRIIASLDNVYQRIVNKALFIFLGNAIKTFFVSSFILFIFHRLITRHLNRLSNHISNINVEKSIRLVSLDRLSGKKKRPDELDQIVSSINKMQTNLKASYRELEKTNSQLKNEIHERKLAEKALEENEKNFRAMAENSPLAIYMSTGLEYKAEYINPTFTELFGYTLEEVPSAKQWWPLAYPDEEYRKQVENEWQKKVSQAIKTKSNFEPVEVIVTCKDGSKKNISWGFTNIGKKNWAFGYDLTKLKQAEKHIKKSLKEKETLLEEIHHRVKNNMNVICSLLKLQAANVDDNRIKEILRESQNRVYSMSAVHEALHGSDNLSEIDFNTYLSKITTTIFQTYNIERQNIKLNSNIVSSNIDIDQAYPIGLVANELISNALKYAFPNGRKGEITVEAKNSNEELTLVISDNGIGIPKECYSQESNTLGLTLVRNLVESQLEGTIEFDTRQGTKIIIKVPLDT